MKCPKCNRLNADDKKVCIYCGKSLDSNIKNNPITDVNKTFAQIKEATNKSKIKSIPDTMELSTKDISSKNSSDDILHDGTKDIEIPLDDDGWVENQAEMTLERALNILIGIKESFQSTHINSKDYDKLVLEVIKDYIMPMDDKEKINFVANGIAESELNDYINDDIRKELKSFVIDYVVNK
jgi:hypothetical protein